MSSEPSQAQQGRKWLKLLAIHSDLDEWGLTPNEFRVYAHLCRRANKDSQCWPGIRSIAETCCLKLSSVRRAISGLALLKLVDVQQRGGASTLYVLTEPEVWVKRVSNNHGRTRVLPEEKEDEPLPLMVPVPEKGGVPERGGVWGTNRDRGGVPESTHEVNPLKEIHSEVNPSTDSSTSSKTKRKQFQVPKLEEIESYALSVQIPRERCAEFFDHFSSNGWKVGGKAKMVDWQAALRNWNRNSQKFAKPANQSTPTRMGHPNDPAPGGRRAFAREGLFPNENLSIPMAVFPKHV